MKKAFWLLTILFFSCYADEKEKLLQPSPDLTINYLLKNEYKRVYGIDVLMYTRTLEGIVHDYQYGDNENLEAQIWRVKNVEIKNIEDYKSVLRKFYLIPVAQIDVNETVAVKSLIYHCVYLCNYSEDKKRLSIAYYHIAEPSADTIESLRTINSDFLKDL